MPFIRCLLIALSISTTSWAKSPNVLVILTDDQGWGDLSGNGNSNLNTPNLDRLAGEGASFDRFYVSPVCSPTRAEFLTGRYHTRCGVYSTSAGGERLNLDEMTIADAFKTAGYATGAWGKWHNGMQYPYHPNGRGFEEFYGFCSGHWGDYFDPMLEHNGEIVTGKGFVVDDCTERAMDFIEEKSKAGKPFFAYLPYNTPHSPMQVPDRWWNKFEFKDLEMRSRDQKKENVGHTRAALAMCENIDWNVGRLLAKLDALGIADDTIVVFFCDNGPNGVRWNGGMRGRKGTTDEGGVRSPLFVRWPGKIESGRKVDRIASAIDLLPTLADLAKIKVEWKKPVDGMSLKPLLVGGETITWPDRHVFSTWKGRVSLRTQRHRLDDKGRLYDMIEDPGQSKDIAAKLPEVTGALRDELAGWKSEVLPGEIKDERPFVVGHPGSKLTQIPARDGKIQGGIKRSNRFPNCSYFTNWRTVEDRITWDVEVGQAGAYEVDVYYTCAKKDLGSKIELRLGSKSITAVISKENDPPVEGAADDRVKRMESYVKEFKPMRIGTIQLEEGEGELTLRALEIPGSSVMDFRLLMLRRIE